MIIIVVLVVSFANALVSFYMVRVVCAWIDCPNCVDNFLSVHSWMWDEVSSSRAVTTWQGKY